MTSEELAREVAMCRDLVSTYSDLCPTAVARIVVALADRVQELEAALRPFAKIAEHYKIALGDPVAAQMDYKLNRDDGIVVGGTVWELRLSHLLAAKAALKGT